MMAGGFFIGGLWLIYLAGRTTFTADEKRFLAGLGGKVAAVFGIVYLAAGVWAASVQPDAVKAGLAGNGVIRFTSSSGFAGYGWLALVGLAVLVGAFAGFGKIAASWLGWAAVLVAVLIEIMLTVYRDGVRDLTLLSKGYDVWNRAVVTNWCGRGPLPGSLCRGPGRHWLARVRSGARQKSYGGRGLTSDESL